MSGVDTSLDDALVQWGRPAHTEGRHVNMPVELGSTMVVNTLAAFESARDARHDRGTLYYGQLVRFNIGLEDLGSLKRDLSLALPHLSSLSE